MITRKVKGVKQNVFSLSFSKDLEKEFVEDYVEKSLIHVRISLVLAVLFYSVFGILDTVVMPSAKHDIWIIRFCVFMPLTLSVFIFSFFKSFKNHMQWTVSTVFLTAGIGIVVMIMIAPSPGNQLYYAGLLLVFIYCFTFVRLRFVWATLMGWLIIIAYEIVAVTITNPSTAVFISNNFFFLGCSLIGMFACYSIEYYFRKDFIQARLLKEEKAKVEKANQNLEQRVYDRTAELLALNTELKEEIEERRKAEAELREAKHLAEAANRIKGEFLANMSHELRTPLNHVIGFTELIVDKQFGALNERQEEYLSDALQSGKHLLSLINDILDLSRVEAGKWSLNAAEVNLCNVLESSLDLIRETVSKRSIQLSLDMDNAPEKIKADEGKLKQILLNLLSNASKFTPDGGTIRVTAEKAEGAYVKISVFDTGIGIEKDDLERIFTPFEQVDGSINRKYQGAGLGLSLSRSLVEIHGGKIWAHSEGKDQGTAFHLLLPV